MKYTHISFLQHILAGKRMLLLLLLGIQIIAGLLPLLINYAMSLIINTVATTPNAGNIGNIKDYIVVLVVTYALFLFLDDVFAVVHAFISDYFGDLIQQKAKFIILQKTSLYPTDDLFYTPKIADLISLCKKNIENISSYINVISFFIKGLFSFFPAIIAVFYLKWWISILLVVTAIPMCWSKIYFQKCIWDRNKRFAYAFNIMNLNEESLFCRYYSKEVKVFGMQNHILKCWNEHFFKIFETINKIRKKGAYAIIFLSVFNAVGIAVCFHYFADSTISGNFTVGSMSFLFSTALQLKNSISGFIYGAGRIVEARLILDPMIDLLNIEEPKTEKTSEHSKAIKETDSSNAVTMKKQSISNHKPNKLISMHNIRFHYPTSSKQTIDGISLDINHGEKIAIIGENGSGKTTLIRLLCRLHTISDGTMLWNEKNLNSIDFAEYRKQIAAVFQDFARFPLSVRDNVDVRKQCIKDDAILNRSLQKEGLMLLRNKLDCYLSASVKDGVELSGGQWQKLAITRIMLDIIKNEKLKLVIFDEPTAALDPNSEQMIMQQILDIPKNKTLIITSHRLALTRFMDRILVMEKGKIIEDGNHDFLMKLGGVYRSMYNKQASLL